MTICTGLAPLVPLIDLHCAAVGSPPEVSAADAAKWLKRSSKATALAPTDLPSPEASLQPLDWAPDARCYSPLMHEAETGVAQELARLAAQQKNWGKDFDQRVLSWLDKTERKQGEPSCLLSVYLFVVLPSVACPSTVQCPLPQPPPVKFSQCALHPWPHFLQSPAFCPMIEALERSKICLSVAQTASCQPASARLFCRPARPHFWCSRGALDAARPPPQPHC